MAHAKNLKDSRFFAGFQTMAKHRYFYPALVAIATFVVFWQVIGFEFVLYDDNLNVYENPYVQSVTVPNILHYWKNPDHGNMYLPVTKTVWAIQALFARTTRRDSNKVEFNPAVFHAVNLILHIANAILVFLILRVLIKDELACFLGALLFTIHPVQVESVAWVTGLKDVLSGFFSLVAIRHYLLYAKLSMESLEGNTADGDSVHEDKTKNRKILHYLAAIFAFLLALLSKPARIIVPIATFALDYFILKRRLRHIALSLIGFVAIALPVIIFTIILEHSRIQTATDLSLLERILVSSDSLVFYLYKLIVPIPLGPDYGRTPAYVLSQHLIYFAWIIPVVLLVVMYTIKKHRSWLLASAGIFVAGVLPVLGFIQFQFQGISTVADRYLYLSMLGPGMAMAFFLSRDILPMNRKRLIAGMCVVMLGLLGILSIRQTRYWGNTTTFSKHALEVNPDSSAFHINLGLGLAQEGKYDEAVFYFSEALKFPDNKVKAHINWGNVLTQQGKLDEAVYHYAEALKIAPDDVSAHAHLGNALAQQEKFDEAAFHYAEVLRFFPDSAEARSNLGYALARQGKFDDAIYNLREALRLSPDDAGAHTNLGIVLAQQGDIDEAIVHFTEALRIDPNYQDASANLIKAKSLKK